MLHNYTGLSSFFSRSHIKSLLEDPCSEKAESCMNIIHNFVNKITVCGTLRGHIDMYTVHGFFFCEYLIFCGYLVE